MCPGMAAEALRLGDASAEEGGARPRSVPMGLLGWQSRIWALCDASTCKLRRTTFKFQPRAPQNGGATGLSETGLHLYLRPPTPARPLPCAPALRAEWGMVGAAALYFTWRTPKGCGCWVEQKRGTRPTSPQTVPRLATMTATRPQLVCVWPSLSGVNIARSLLTYNQSGRQAGT